MALYLQDLKGSNNRYKGGLSAVCEERSVVKLI